MRLLNTIATGYTSLFYPPGIDVVPPLPDTKNILKRLSSEWVVLFFFLFPQLTHDSGPECDQVAVILGIAPLEGDVVDRRQQIADYLGCAIICRVT